MASFLSIMMALVLVTQFFFIFSLPSLLKLKLMALLIKCLPARHVFVTMIKFTIILEMGRVIGVRF